MARVSSRRRGRVLAMKLLYQVASTQKPLDDLCEGFVEFRDAPKRVREFGLNLASGILARKPEIDRMIREFLKNWEFDRLAVIDLQIMRIGVYELVYSDDLSAGIVIDEAIEISREYSTGESYRFVNGVLGALCSKYAQHKTEAKKSRRWVGPEK